MKKTTCTVFAFLLALSLLAGCGGSPSSASPSASATPSGSVAPSAGGDEEILIGYSLNTMDSTMKITADFYERTALAEGWTPILLNANGDVTTELANVESLINSGVKAVVIMGVDTEGSAAAVKACSDAGIPCIIAGRKINADEEDYYTYVSGDHYMAGETQAAYINDYLDAHPDKKLNLAFIYGQSGNSNVAARHAGFEDACLKNPINADRVTLVAEQYAEFDAEKAYNVTTDMLQTYPDINCFVTQSDDMAGGIINAIKAQGRDVKDYMIVSIDCSAVGIGYLRSGELDATILMAMPQLATAAVDYIHAAMDGKVVDKQNPIANYYQLATIDNLDELLAANGLEG